MSADVRAYDVDSVETMESLITQAIRDGYTLGNKTAMSASLVIRKESFNPLVFLVLLFLLVIPGVLYFVAYELAKDQVVEITVNRALLEAPDEDAFIHLDALRLEGFVTDDEFARVRERIRSEPEQ
jgi:hypothetical protein